MKSVRKLDTYGCHEGLRIHRGGVWLATVAEKSIFMAVNDDHARDNEEQNGPHVDTLTAQRPSVHWKGKVDLTVLLVTYKSTTGMFNSTEIHENVETVKV